MNNQMKKYIGWGPGGSQAQNLLSQWTGMGHLPACHHPRGSSGLPVHEFLWSKNEFPDSLFELLWHWPIRETEGPLIIAGWGRSPDPLPPPLWSPLTLWSLFFFFPLLTWILFLFKFIYNVVLVSVDKEVIKLYIYICLLFLYIFSSIMVCHRILNVVSLCHAVGPCCLSVLYIKTWCPGGVGEPGFPLHLLGHRPDAGTGLPWSWPPGLVSLDCLLTTSWWG